MKKIIFADDLLSAVREDMTIRGAAYAAIVSHINAASAVDVAPVVHGRWIERTNRGRLDFRYECSVCHGGSDLETSYCPGCGSIMDLPNVTEATSAALLQMGAKAHGGHQH